MERLDGYVRVSQVGGRSGERFQSPDQQRDAISAWANAHGVHVAAWHEDLDRSGGTMDRPGMNEALRRVRAGETGGIIVARIDRFARTVVGGLTTIRDLHEMGARVVSVAEQIDPATPLGRAMLGLLLIMAEWHRDLADESLSAAQHRAATAGRFPGKAPYGYRKTTDGLTAVDDARALIVARIFTARANGKGWRAIADSLIADEIPTPTGRTRWAPSTLWGIVRSEAPLGVFVGPRGLRVEDAWPAIIDRGLWRRANDIQGALSERAGHADRLYAGLVRCAWCRTVMGRTVNPHGFVSYGCLTRGCTQRTSIGAHLLDAHVSADVDERLQRHRLTAQPVDDETSHLRSVRDGAVAELEAWRDDVGLRTVLGEHDWREGLLARARARDEAEADLAAAEQRAGLTGLAALPDAVRAGVQTLPWEVRRRVVAFLVHSVWVRRSPVRGEGARRHVAHRLRVVWRDDRELPRLPSRSGPELGPLRW